MWHSYQKPLTQHSHHNMLKVCRTRSFDNTAGVGANDPQGRRQLARYMIRNPFSLKKMEYRAQQGMVVYRSRHHATLKRNFQIMPGAAWLKLLLQHVQQCLVLCLLGYQYH